MNVSTWSELDLAASLCMHYKSLRPRNNAGGTIAIEPAASQRNFFGGYAKEQMRTSCHAIRCAGPANPNS